MLLISNVKIPSGFNFENLAPICGEALQIDPSLVKTASLHRRSIDARRKSDVHFICSFLVEIENESEYLSRCNIPNISPYSKKEYSFFCGHSAPKVKPIVVGFGPAGMFAALTLSRAGFCPIVIERGGDVESRKKSVEFFWKNGKLDINSNIQFGEGGAGTFSDGKLTTGIKDIRCRAVLKEFVRHGADSNILYDAKPHIGTDVLCKIVKSIREEIISLGGEIHFNTSLLRLEECNGKVCCAVIKQGEKETEIPTEHIILAIGHSARDTFLMLKNQGIYMERKPFAVGARIEHKQSHIDKAQLGSFAKCPEFTPMDYKLSHHLKNGRGVYTFCMCPGGIVVNAASEENAIVTNGMSYSDRGKSNANSALLVGVNPDDFKSDDVLAGVEFQREIERRAYSVSNSYRAPAQMVGDFLNGIPSKGFGEIMPSFPTGVVAGNLDDVLPKFVTDAMREGIYVFNRKLSGFATADAVLTAPETRSSSPVRIVRSNTLHSSIEGLIPCGEGAGYAGGIMSAAVDGIKCAEAIIERF